MGKGKKCKKDVRKWGSEKKKRCVRSAYLIDFLGGDEGI